MGRAYSMDLRERVVAAVAQDGLSRRQAAARFGVSDSDPPPLKFSNRRGQVALSCCLLRIAYRRAQSSLRGHPHKVPHVGVGEVDRPKWSTRVPVVG